jgi:hypothetical protein
MLWLLATLSVVTLSWGIAHRLKAVSPAANCTGERCSCRLDDRTLTCEALLAPKPKDDPPTLERGTLP